MFDDCGGPLEIYSFVLINDTHIGKKGWAVFVFDTCETQIHRFNRIYDPHHFTVLIKEKDKVAVRKEVTGKWIRDNCRSLSDDVLLDDMRNFLCKSPDPLSRAYRRRMQEKFLERQRRLPENNRCSTDEIKRQLRLIAGPDDPIDYP